MGRHLFGPLSVRIRAARHGLGLPPGPDRRWRSALDALEASSGQFVQIKMNPCSCVPPPQRPRRKRIRLLLEGQFNWDGARWTETARQFGIDLNRNFPAHWAPFSMFGMDGGIFSLSEPESRAVVDTFTAYPRIGAAVTNHTYTGCILTQPYREDTPSPMGTSCSWSASRKRRLKARNTACSEPFPTLPTTRRNPS